jgi:hypothetical protein
VRELQQWFVINGRRAYPDIKDTKTQDRMLRRQFEDAFVNYDQQEYVKDRDVQTLAEAANAALRWEAKQRGE